MTSIDRGRQVACLSTSDDYALIRHHIELTDELALRRAARPDLIDALTIRAQRDITKENQ